MAKRGFKIRKVTGQFRAPSAYSVSRGHKTYFNYEVLECGHIHQEPEISSNAEAVRVVFKLVTNTPQKRRCFECVTGEKAIPEPSPAHIPEEYRR